MTDLIDRQAAIDTTMETVFVEYEDGDPRKDESIILQTKAAIRDGIKALPPVYVPDTNVGDMISRQAAIEMLMNQNVIMDGSEYHNGFNAGVNRAQEVIRNLLPVQPETNCPETPDSWIPVSERMPDNTDTVLIVHKGGVSTGWYNGRYWERGASSNHRMLKTVTHWMPFPKAPKGE